MKTYTLFTEIAEQYTSSASSSYFTVNDLLVRVSNHLPNVSNFEEYNANLDRVLLIFTDTDLTENQIEKFIETEMSNYFVDYLIYDEKYCNIETIKNKINILS